MPTHDRRGSDDRLGAGADLEILGEQVEREIERHVEDGGDGRASAR